MNLVGSQYALGQSGDEYARLVRQAELLEPMTRRLLEDAGVASGMRVLDLGSGTGDLCMLVAGVVGARGSVVGVDIDGNVIKFARERVYSAGFNNIEFAHCDSSQYLPLTPFDAIVGRSVLMYQPDPSKTLAKAARHLRADGVVAFMEPWMMPPQGPDSPMKRVASCILETLHRSGAHTDLGPRLHRVFTAAGLPQPKMRFEGLIDGRDESPLYQHCADTMASLLPKAIEHGVVSPGEIDVEDVPARLRSAMNAIGYAVSGMAMVLAWCRLARSGPSKC